MGAESSFTASIMVLKLVVKRSLLVVLETMHLAFLGACLPMPRMQIHVFPPPKPGQEKHFFCLGTTRAGKPMSRVERAMQLKQRQRKAERIAGKNPEVASVTRGMV